MSLTADDTIRKRVEIGFQFTEPWARRSLRNANRYLGRPDEDSTAEAWDTWQRTLVEGEVNPVAINIRQAAAAISIAVPDFDVESDDPDAAEMVRADLRKEFEKMNIERLGRRCEILRRVQSMAWLRYFWSDTGFRVEPVKPRDLFCDPYTTDMGWERLRWGGCRVYLPPSEAVERYGAGNLGLVGNDVAQWEKDAPGGVQVDLYWDATTEAEIVKKWKSDQFGAQHVISRPNPYGRVPMVCLLGDPDPISEFPLSNFETSGGPSRQHRNLQAIINEQARNGGGSLWINSTYIDAETQEALASGDHRGPIFTKGVPGENVIGYTQNQALSETVMAALANVQRGIEIDMAVSNLDLGQTTGARTATENAFIANRSNARSAAWRKEFERFLTLIAAAVVDCKVRFGADPRVDGESPELWAAYKSVTRVRVMEETSAWKDPAIGMQTEMQLFSAALQAFQYTLMLGRPIDLTALFEDLLRAFNKRSTSRYFMSPEDAQRLMQSSQKPGKGPAETLSYKDAPPDVRRQIEEQAGLVPSQAPESTPQDVKLQMAALRHEADLQRQQGEALYQSASHGADMAKVVLQRMNGGSDAGQ